MANRVTGSEVKEIISTTLSAEALAPFITAANLLVTAKAGSSAYSTAELKELERWLSAHFVSIRDPSKSAVVEKQVGESRERYAVMKSSGVKRSLETTPYGQQVLILDYLGCFADIGARTASLTSVGATNEDFD